MPQKILPSDQPNTNQLLRRPLRLIVRFLANSEGLVVEHGPMEVWSQSLLHMINLCQSKGGANRSCSLVSGIEYILPSTMYTDP
jgi:hypothetical protein